MLSKFSLDTHSKKKIAFLRFILDTCGENFVYEEAGYFKKYSFVVFCGVVKRADERISYYCYRDFIKLYRRDIRWPAVHESQDNLYHNGLARYQDLIKQQRVKIIHAQFLTDAVFCYPMIKKLNLPLVVSLRGYDLFHPNIMRHLKIVSPVVSRYLVKSESMKKALAAYGCDPDKIQVVYGGVNTDKIIFKPRAPSEKNIKILSAGRFTEKKGYDVTLAFFSELIHIFPQAQLTVIGEGEGKDGIVQLAEQLGITDRITIKAYMPHTEFIKELYQHNLFVLSSRTAQDGNQEGIPNVLKEAMASGMPVISTRHSGIPELITDQETGYLVDENDHTAMVDKAKTIVESREKVVDVCINARFFVEKHFNANKSAAQIEQVYNYVLMPDFVRSAVDVREGRKPTQFRMDLHLSKGCNSKCIMCGNWKTPVYTSYSRKAVSDLLDQLRSFGVDQVRFHGQEPTLMKDIFSIIQEARAKGFRTGLKTNALIFSDEETVKKLNGGLNELYLSIDSSDAHIHNSMRGNDISFSRNMFLLTRLRAINPDIDVYFNAVIANKNYRDLEGLLDTAQSMGVNRVSFVHLADKNDEIKNLRLSREQFEEFCFQIWPRILKKSADYDIPVSLEPYFLSLIHAPIHHQISVLKNSPDLFKDEITNFLDGLYGKKFYEQYTCYGVLDHGTIDWDGNVYPCCAMPRPPELAIGNIREKSFQEIWNSEKYKQYRKDILQGKCQFKETCSRSFKKTIHYNTFLGGQEDPGPVDPSDFRNQYKMNAYTAQYYLEKMVYYAFSKSKIYRKKFENVMGDGNKIDVSVLPFITREELKNAFPKTDIVPNYFEEDYGVYRTSSCGSAAFLYARPLDSNTFHRMATSFVHTGQWRRGEPWVKMTSINCLEAQYPLKIYSSKGDSQNKAPSAVVIPANDDFLNVPLSDIKEIYECIRNSHARLIHANPTHLKLLLHRFRKENLRLEGHYAVHSTYEILLPSTQKWIRRYLDCRIYNQYGCSEIGPISFWCRHGKNHIFHDTVHVDIVPVDGLNRPDIGRVVVTHLKNHVMPFVRYFNGDFAYRVKDSSCDCGLKSPVMGDIIGREVEMIRYKGKVVFPLEIDALFGSCDNVLMYRVIVADGQFHIQWVPADDDVPVAERELEDRFRMFFGDERMRVRVEKADRILPKRRGKYASVVVQ